MPATISKTLREWRLPFDDDLAVTASELDDVVRKFGINRAVGTSFEDVWTLGGSYDFPTEAISLQASSDDVDDTGVEIWVEGLDADLFPVTASADLNGQGRVNVGTTEQFFRVFRAYVAGSVEPEGNIYVYESGVGITAGVPDTLSDTKAYIEADLNQTEMAIYTIPNDKIGIVRSTALPGGGVTVAGKLIGIEGHLMARQFGGVFRAQVPTVNVSGAGGGIQWSVPLRYPGGTDLKLIARAATDSAQVAGGFELILLDPRKTT